jgi:hypothetical protein
MKSALYLKLAVLFCVALIVIACVHYSYDIERLEFVILIIVGLAGYTLSRGVRNA